jgi:competence protein ComEA
MHEPKSKVETDAVESEAPPVPADDVSAEDQLAAVSARVTTAPVELVNDTGPEQPPRTWFRRGDQLFVGIMVIAVIVLMAVHWVRLSGWGMLPIEIDRLPERQLDFQLEINRATWIEWMQLEGVGDTLARRIVEDRQTNGPFSSIDDIERVKGIGPKTIEKLRPWLRVEPVAGNDPADDSSQE